MSVHISTIFGEFSNLATYLHQSMVDGRKITLDNHGDLIIPLYPRVASQIISDLHVEVDKL